MLTPLAALPPCSVTSLWVLLSGEGLERAGEEEAGPLQGTLDRRRLDRQLFGTRLDDFDLVQEGLDEGSAPFEASHQGLGNGVFDALDLDEALGRHAADRFEGVELSGQQTRELGAPGVRCPGCARRRRGGVCDAPRSRR